MRHCTEEDCQLFLFVYDVKLAYDCSQGRYCPGSDDVDENEARLLRRYHTLILIYSSLGPYNISLSKLNYMEYRF